METPEFDALSTAEDYYRRALAKAAHADHEGAIADYIEALDGSVPLPNIRGAIGDLGRAIAERGEATHLGPMLAPAYRHLGVGRYNDGDLSGAIADFTEAIRLDPSLAVAYHDR